VWPVGGVDTEPAGDGDQVAPAARLRMRALVENVHDWVPFCQ